MKGKRFETDRAEQTVLLEQLSRDTDTSARTLSRWKTECAAAESEHRPQLAEIAEDIRRLRRIIRVRGSR